MSHFSCIYMVFHTNVILQYRTKYANGLTSLLKVDHAKLGKFIFNAPRNNFLNNAEVALSIFMRSTFDKNGKHQKTLCGHYFGVILKISVWLVDYYDLRFE